MIGSKPFYLFLMFCIIVGPLFAQPMIDRYEFIPFSRTASGTQSVIISLLEGPEGYIWIGTYDGLYRYDGFAFKGFIPPHDPQGQQGLHIKKLHIKEDYLYAASTRGLQIVHLPTLVNRTINLTVRGGKDVASNRIFDIQEDSQGRLWLLTPYALHQLNHPDEEVYHIPLPDTLVATGRTMSNHSRLTILENGEIWIEGAPHNQKDMTLRYRPETGTFQLLDLVAGNSKDAIVQLNSQLIFYASYPEKPELGTINPADGVRHPIMLPDGFLSDNPQLVVLPFDDSSLELSIDHKKWLFDLQTKQLTELQLPVFLTDPEDDRPVRYHLYQTSKGITIGFCNRGLVRFIDERRNFRRFFNVDQFLNIGDNSLSRVERFDSIIWALHFGDGGAMLSSQGDLLRHVHFEESKPFALPNYWWNISRLNRDTFWIGTSEGLYWYALTSRQHGRVFRDGLPDAVQTKPITTQFIDTYGEMWMGIGGGNGAIRWSIDRNLFKYYPVEKDGLPFRYPKSITEDANGDLWMGCQTGGGLVRWDRQRDTFEVIRSQPDSKFANDLIDIITISNDGLLYFGGWGGGLYEYDPKSRQFRHWSKEEGLSNNYIQDLAWDEKGHLWIGTSNGLNKLTLKDNTITTYYTIHGLPSNLIEFVQKYGDSTLLVMTPSGTRIFNPDHLQLDPMENPLHISQLEINGIVNNERLQQQEPLRLTYRQNNLTFELSQVNLLDGMLNLFEYRFKNDPVDWQPMNSGHRLTLVGLSPGRHQLQFRVSNNHKYQIIEPVHIHIRPPFWRSTWLYLIVGLIGGGIMVIYGRIRVRNMIRQQNLRNQISADLHDDIGSSLSSIRFMLEKMTKNRKGRSNQLQQLNPIMEELGHINQNLEEIIWYIKPSTDTLDEIHLRLRRFSSELLETRDIDLQWDQQTTFDGNKLNSYQKRDYFLIFKEIINNAAKHSQAEHVKVVISSQNHHLHLEITDDGIGFDPKAPTGSNGMFTLRARAVRLAGQLDIDSSAGRGARIRLDFPFR